jgi:hypothetical protein
MTADVKVSVAQVRLRKVRKPTRESAIAQNPALKITARLVE